MPGINVKWSLGKLLQMFFQATKAKRLDTLSPFNDLSRLSSGHKTKARRWGYAGGKAPIGYRAERGGKTLTLDEEKAQTVKRVFELWDAETDASRKKIADILNSEGYIIQPKKANNFTLCRLKGSWIGKLPMKVVTGMPGIEATGKYPYILCDKN